MGIITTGRVMGWGWVTPSAGYMERRSTYSVVVVDSEEGGGGLPHIGVQLQWFLCCCSGVVAEEDSGSLIS